MPKTPRTHSTGWLNIALALPIITAVLLVFGGCGGGGGINTTTPVATPEDTVEGVISGFGSIFVNGVRFSTSNTVFNIDDGIGAETDLGVGMFVRLRGTINADGITGSCSSVEFEDDLDGPIDSIDTDNQQLIILGQTVIVDASTVLNGVESFAELQVGNIVEISGEANTDGDIVATSLRFISAAFDGRAITLRGIVEDLDSAALHLRCAA